VPKRLGIFGGTSDPVHHGHLILAEDAIEHFDLDGMLFIPAAVSPHRIDCPPAASAAHRVEMLKHAIKDEPRFAIDECEIHRPPPSYTFDTVCDVRSRHPDAQLHVLIGADQFSRLPTWHRFAELKPLVAFVIFTRANAAGETVETGHPTLRRRLDISATELRKRVASGLSLRYLVPGAVAEYVDNHQLYREANPP
jgi:nicotinate-nucleotide adenylyltransferase